LIFLCWIFCSLKLLQSNIQTKFQEKRAQKAEDEKNKQEEIIKGMIIQKADQEATQKSQLSLLKVINNSIQKSFIHLFFFSQQDLQFELNLQDVSSQKIISDSFNLIISYYYHSHFSYILFWKSETVWEWCWNSHFNSTIIEHLVRGHSFQIGSTQHPKGEKWGRNKKPQGNRKQLWPLFHFLISSNPLKKMKRKMTILRKK